MHCNVKILYICSDKLDFSTKNRYNKYIHLTNHRKELEMSKRYSRSGAREEAFKLVFQINQHTDDMDFLFDCLTEAHPNIVSCMPYIQKVVTGVMEKEEELLNIIGENLASGWRTDRISKVSKSILLLAVYEMKYVDDVPEKVAINEAVELAKKFDEPSSASFVNGVLAGVINK